MRPLAVLLPLLAVLAATGCHRAPRRAADPEAAAARATASQAARASSAHEDETARARTQDQRQGELRDARAVEAYRVEDAALAEARGALRAWGRDKLAATDRVIAAGRAAAATASPARGAVLAALLLPVEAQRSALFDDLATLRRQSAVGLVSFRLRTLARCRDLDARVASLQSELQRNQPAAATAAR